MRSRPLDDDRRPEPSLPRPDDDRPADERLLEGADGALRDGADDLDGALRVGGADLDGALRVGADDRGADTLGRDAVF